MTRRVFTAEELKKRAFLRAAHVLYGHWEEGTGAHSRLFETLIPEGGLLLGTSVEGPGWREHVVPCAVIRDRCLQLFDDGKSIEDVAAYIEAHLKIVVISREERDRLDFKLGLKSTMPIGWEDGDIMARLKAAGIQLGDKKTL